LSQKKHHDTIGHVQWCYDRHDQRRPSLILVPPKKQHTTDKKTALFRVQLQFGMEHMDWIPPVRLLPIRCNVGMDETSQSSPYYNHLLTTDGVRVSDVVVHDNMSDYPHWHASVVLMRIWCLQRGLLRGHDSLDTNQIALLVLYLYRMKLVSPRLGSLAVLTALLKLIVETDWLGEDVRSSSLETSGDVALLIRKAPHEGYSEVFHSTVTRARKVLVMPNHGTTQVQTIQASHMAALYAQVTRESPLTPNDPPTLLAYYETRYTLGPVFLDPTMTHNYFGSLSPCCMRLLQQEAQRSLQCWHTDSMISQVFHHLFMTPARFWNSCDVYLRIPLSYFASPTTKTNMMGSTENPWDVGQYEAIVRRVVTILRRGLGDRVPLIRVLTCGNGPVLKPSTFSENDSDQCMLHTIVWNQPSTKTTPMQSSLGEDSVVLGFTLDPNTSARLVDRGPPAEDTAGVAAFKEFWGSKAELRRFKDGAIIHAVVWDGGKDAKEQHFKNGDKWQGSIVEQITRHLLSTHFLKKDCEAPYFLLRDIASCIDIEAVDNDKSDVAIFNPVSAHRSLSKTFDLLSEFLRKYSQPTVDVPGTSAKQSRLGVPLTIESVEPLAPALRFAELFPPIPHPLLGGPVIPGASRASGAIQSEPILIQIRFGASSKWPGDLRAISAAKTAMLIQLVNGIEAMQTSGISDAKAFRGPRIVTPSYADVAFMGYAFRILVHAEPELKVLQGLSKPKPEAQQLLTSLHERHVTASLHHSMMHALYTRHPTSSAVVRLLKRWMSCHLFSGLVPFEAMELLVAYVYSDTSAPTSAPASLISGWLRVLHLIASHKWSREPLWVDPTRQLTEDDGSLLQSDFDTVRGKEYKHGPPLFLVAPYNRPDKNDRNMNRWYPTSSIAQVEWVVWYRVMALAQKSFDYLMNNSLMSSKSNDAWRATFSESDTVFRQFSALLRVDPHLCLDLSCSSSSSTSETWMQRDTTNTDDVTSLYTRSMRYRQLGPKSLQHKLYRNLSPKDETAVLLEWRPVDALVEQLRDKLGHWAVFFYNDQCPQVVGVVWRPVVTQARAFSALTAEYARPVRSDDWQSDTLVTVNIHDLLREIQQYSTDIIVNYKVMDTGYKIEQSVRKRKLIENTHMKKRSTTKESKSSESSSSDNDSD
jgi:U3 small nucleolar RNA-associated protein 22